MSTHPDSSAAAATNANNDARELGFMILHEMVDTVAMYMTVHFPSLVQLYSSGLRDSTPQVAIMAMKALGGLISFIADEEDKVKIFGPLVPQLFYVTSACHARRDDHSREETLNMVCEVVVDLVFCKCKEVKEHSWSMKQMCMQLMGTMYCWRLH